jgi:hypothetical protein
VLVPLLNVTGRRLAIQKGQLIAMAEEVDVLENTCEGTEDGRSSASFNNVLPAEDVKSSRSPVNSGTQTVRKLVLEDKKPIKKGEGADVKSQDDTQGDIVIPEHLRQLMTESSKHLTEQQTSMLASLLVQYQDRFSTGDSDLGCFTAIRHTIDTNGAKPIKQKMRRTPLGFQEEEDKLLQKMVDSGVIEESSSGWASPSVLVRKKDGSVRWCIDFRALNAVTVKDAYPLPNINECLDTLADSQFFSSLDMASGYWQIDLEAQDRPKTAFLTKHGLYQFKRMPFGLCNAPSTFQRAMHVVFRGMTWHQLLTYLDDLMIVGKNFCEHLANLQMTLERLRTYDLKLKPKKCKLFQTEVMFLGRLVSTEGISINP